MICFPVVLQTAAHLILVGGKKEIDDMQVGQKFASAIIYNNPETSRYRCWYGSQCPKFGPEKYIRKRSPGLDLLFCGGCF